MSVATSPTTDRGTGLFEDSAGMEWIGKELPESKMVQRTVDVLGTALSHHLAPPTVSAITLFVILELFRATRSGIF